MRGKGYTTAAESEENRITPAYAGKRWEGLKMAQDFEDHPRLCGEKQLPERHGQGWLRITPAYAGKSLYNTSNAICIQDHPRLCGEKQLTSSSGIQQIRITPAYAGKSASQSTPAGT